MLNCEQAKISKLTAEVWLGLNAIPRNYVKKKHIISKIYRFWPNQKLTKDGSFN